MHLLEGSFFLFSGFIRFDSNCTFSNQPLTGQIYFFKTLSFDSVDDVKDKWIRQWYSNKVMQTLRVQSHMCRIVNNNNNNNPRIIVILTPERRCSDQAAENTARLQWRPLLLLPSGPGSCLALSEACLLQPDPSGGKTDKDKVEQWTGSKKGPLKTNRHNKLRLWSRLPGANNRR